MRLGSFKIARHVIEDTPEIARKVMGEVIVVRCEQMYYDDTLTYTAISDHFDELPIGRALPEYAVMVDSDMNITFKKYE